MPEKIYPEFTILLILISVLLAILQYLNNTHKEYIRDAQNPLKELDLDSDNPGMKKLRKVLDGVLNIEIIGLRKLIEVVYIGLVLQAALFCLSHWLGGISFFDFNISIFHLLTDIFSLGILVLYLWGGRVLYRMRKQQNDIETRAKRFLENYDFVRQTLSDNSVD